MRILKINSILIDIDEQTALGITFQGYDMKNPAKPRSVNYSNNFSTPRTANNDLIIGIIGDCQNKSTLIYQKLTIDYWIDNIHIINQGSCRIDSISDRVNWFIYDNIDIWNNLKKYHFFWTPPYIDTYFGSYVDGCELDIYNWLLDVKKFAKYSSGHKYYAGDIETFLQSPDYDYTVPYYLSNYYNDPTASPTEFIGKGAGGYKPQIIISTQNGTVPYKSGHVCVNIKTIFEFLEYKYGCNFNINDTSIIGNVFTDSKWGKVKIPSREVDVMSNWLGAGDDTFYYRFATNSQSTFQRVDVIPYDNIFVYDIVNTFFEIANVIIDQYTSNYTGLQRNYIDIIGAPVTSGVLHFTISGEYVTGGSITFDISITNSYDIDLVTKKIYTYIKANIGLTFSDLPNFSVTYTANRITLVARTGVSFDNSLNMSYTCDSRLTGITEVVNSTNQTSQYNYKVRMFDSLKSAKIIDWSGKLTNIPIFKPYIENFVSINYIKYKNLYSGAAKKLYQKILVAIPQIEGIADLFEINSYMSAVIINTVAGNNVIPDFQLDLSVPESFKFIPFLENSVITRDGITGMITRQVTCNIQKVDYSYISEVVNLFTAGLVDLTDSYNLWQDILSAPKYYEVECYLTLNDVNNLEFFRLVYFKQLGGAFFVNKISNFNPEMSSSPATLELIFITNKTSDIKEFSNKVWVDGISNPFIDGVENNFI